MVSKPKSKRKKLVLPRVLKTLNQVGRSDKVNDRKRMALAPGKRISKNGNIYWETRKNRSDVKGKRV